MYFCLAELSGKRYIRSGGRSSNLESLLVSHSPIRNRAYTGFPDQQILLIDLLYSPNTQSMAGRTLLQADRATPQNKNLVQHIRKRGQSINLSRGFDVCVVIMKQLLLF
jgi:hypothetical protein